MMGQRVPTTLGREASTLNEGQSSPLARSWKEAIKGILSASTMLQDALQILPFLNHMLLQAFKLT